MLKKLKNYIPIILMLAIAVTIGILLMTDTMSIKRIIDTVRDNKPIAFAVIIALFLLKGCAIVIPYAAVLLGSAVVFDIKTAVIINIIGTLLCISVSYLIGRFSKQMTFEKAIAKYPKIEKYFVNSQEYSFTFCFAIHALHLSMEVQGVLFGLLRTPYFTYLASSMLALAPSMMWYTLLGERMGVRDYRFWIFIAIDVVMLIIGLIYTKRNIVDGGKKTR